MMNAAPAPKRRSGGHLAAEGAFAPGAPLHTLSFYRDAPNEELTLEDFEVLAFSRLKREARSCRRAADARVAAPAG